MANNNLLKSYMTLNSISQRELAKELNMSLSALSGKLTGKKEFTVKQAAKICNILNITDNDEKVKIFFS